MSYKITDKMALVVVDAQVDFFEGGALAVPNSNSILPFIQHYLGLFRKLNRLIFLTRDWHPANHCSFKSQKGIWPTHCVQNTNGAEFHSKLEIPKTAVIISKADRRDKDAYSGFEGTSLDGELKNHGIKDIAVCGLATDYCVKHTVLDGLRLGFKTLLLSDGIKGVDLKVGDSIRAVQEMVHAGAIIINRGDLQ